MDFANLEIAGWRPSPEHLQAAAAVTTGIFIALIGILIIGRAAKVVIIIFIGVVVIVGWWGARNGLLASFLGAIPH